MNQMRYSKSIPDFGPASKSKKYPEFVDTEQYEPSGEIYFDTKQAARRPKDEKMNYFLPPINDVTVRPIRMLYGRNST